MSETLLQYCRFCAELKEAREIVDLSIDHETRSQVFYKLSIFGDSKYLEFSHKDLPETVCNVCLASLNDAHEFINKLKSSQKLLLTLLSRDYKEEIIDEDNFNQSEIKIENVRVGEDDFISPSNIKKEIVNKDYFNSLQESTITPLRSDSKTHNFDYKVPKEEPISTAVDQQELKDLYNTSYNSFKESHKLITKEIKETIASNIKTVIDIEPMSDSLITSKPGNITKKQSAKKDSKDPIIKNKKVKILSKNKQSSDTKKDLIGTLYSEKNYTVHQDTNEPEIFCCKICKKTFTLKKTLKTHITTHVGFERKKLQCQLCDKTFHNKNYYRIHIKSHQSSETPYRCQHCNKSFKLKRYWQNHLRLHTGEKPYSCTECSKEFSCWGNCNKHMKRIHGKTLAKTKLTSEGRVQVDQTGEPVNVNLNEDLREWAHDFITSSTKSEGISPYLCVECNKQFTSWGNCNDHMQRIHGTTLRSVKTKLTTNGRVPLCRKAYERQTPIDSFMFTMQAEKDTELKKLLNQTL